LAEYRTALLGPTWQEMLSYDTDWMTREEIVTTTYRVGAGLNDLKREAGLIDEATHPPSTPICAPPCACWPRSGP
jgi:hypothetical protein